MSDTLGQSPLLPHTENEDPAWYEFLKAGIPFCGATLGLAGPSIFLPVLMEGGSNIGLRLAQFFTAAVGTYMFASTISAKPMLKDKLKSGLVPKIAFAVAAGCAMAVYNPGESVLTSRAQGAERERRAAVQKVQAVIEAKRISALPAIDLSTVVATREFTVAQEYCNKYNPGKEVLVPFKGQEFKAICP